MTWTASGTGRTGTSPCESAKRANAYGTKSPGLPPTDQTPAGRNQNDLSQTTALIAEIAATEVSTLEAELNNAVEKARAKAEQEGRHGILVTRHGHSRFTIEISPEVPYGLTQERQAP